MINAIHSITATIEGIIYVGELETHTVLMFHGVTDSVWPGSLFIVLYVALTAKTLDTPGLQEVVSIFGIQKN